MLLLFRFLYTILKSGFRSKIGPLDSSVVRFTALPHDCDLNFHLNAGRFMSFMDIARVELLGRMRVLRPALKRGWRPIMGGTVVRYRRSVMPFETFTIESRVLGWDEKWFYIEHIVQRHDGSLAAIGHMRTLLRRKDGNVAPRELIALMKLDGIVSPPLPEFVEAWRVAEDAR
jgi:acyl-CoA thioesterase FadM